MSDARRTTTRPGTRGGLLASAGFSLVELILALCILSITCLAYAGMQIQAIDVSARAGGLTPASAAAERALESLLRRPYNDVLSGSDALDLPTGERYAVAWTVSNNQPVPNCKTVIITVAGDGPNEPPLGMATVVCSGG